jgi:hypothetical protein
MRHARIVKREAIMSKKGIWPPPVYEAHFSDGAIERLSFWSPDGKPIDFAHGRAVAEALCLTIWDEARRTWERGPDGAWRARWARDAGRQIVTGYVEHPNIGRVADTPEARWQAVAEGARKALERGESREALAILQRAAA